MLIQDAFMRSTSWSYTKDCDLDCSNKGFISQDSFIVGNDKLTTHPVFVLIMMSQVIINYTMLVWINLKCHKEEIIACASSVCL